MGPVFVMERSVAASQGFELAGLVLERNTSHSANWGCSCSEWHGETSLFLPSPYSCVCMCACSLWLNCMHVHSRVQGRVIKEGPREHTTQSSSVMLGDKESTGLSCLQHFLLELRGSLGELKCHIAGAATSLLRRSSLGLRRSSLISYQKQQTRWILPLHTHACMQ